jgi:hypothetical protein
MTTRRRWTEVEASRDTAYTDTSICLSPSHQDHV